MTIAQTLDNRVQRLERQNRWLTAGLFLLLAALLVAASSKEGVPDVVKARAFHVVAKDGTPLVKIEDTFGPFGDSQRAGTITTYGDKGQKLVQLASTARTEGTLSIFNGKEQMLAQLLATIAGQGVLITYDAKGKRLVELGVRTDGPGIVFTYDPRNLEVRGEYTTQ